MPGKDFRYIEHMTDSVVEAYGATLEEAFENSARGLVNTMFDLKKVTPKIIINIEVKGFDLKNLLYNWLEQVLLYSIVDKIVLSRFKVDIAGGTDDNYLLFCSSKGERFNIDKHGYKVEVKAVTYHEMEITEERSKFSIRFLLDL
jgi:SHS2 domain-containing protein